MKEPLIKQGFKGDILEHYSLRELTFYKIGGAANLYLAPKSFSDLKVLSDYYQDNPFSFFILGLGSNILISDHNIANPVIDLRAMPQEQSINSDSFTLSANTPIRALLNLAKEQGFDHFERLAGIPGNIGGSIKMNAGTHLGEISDLLACYEVFNLKTGKLTTINQSEFCFSYRENQTIKNTDIIISATFKIARNTPDKIREKIYQTLIRRKETQPLEMPSCGSVFRNPKGFKAWELIDQAGLKGYKIGGAQVSSKHSNWIINLGSAQAQDVYNLIHYIKKVVWDKFQIELKPEVQFIGQFNDFSSK